jgi:hypothetical protein
MGHPRFVVMAADSGFLTGLSAWFGMTSIIEWFGIAGYERPSLLTRRADFAELEARVWFPPKVIPFPSHAL